MTEEGIIKYKCNHNNSEPLSYAEISVIEAVRKRMKKLNLIGEYEDLGLGFGNISIRAKEKKFLISGSQTGNLEVLTGDHYVYVTDYSLKNNSIESKGPIPPSSESLSHAAIYDHNSKVQAVIHIHNNEIWTKLHEFDIDSTPKEVEYGTQEMALAIQKAIGSNSEGVVLMKGHDDGVLIYAETLPKARLLTEDLYRRFVGDPLEA